MVRKKTAVLLYPYFSNYEVSVALSVLFQAEKPFTVLGLSDTEPVRSEEGLMVLCEARVEDAKREDYDSLLLTGCMQPFDSFMLDDRYVDFVRLFDDGHTPIGAISSAPLLLAKAGMLRDRAYMAGVPEEFMEANGMNPTNQVKGKPYVQDGNLLTSVGGQFVPFGIQFGRMLGLEFSPRWYGDF